MQTNPDLLSWEGAVQDEIVVDHNAWQTKYDIKSQRGSYATLQITWFGRKKAATAFGKWDIWGTSLSSQICIAPERVQEASATFRPRTWNTELVTLSDGRTLLQKTLEHSECSRGVDDGAGNMIVGFKRIGPWHDPRYRLVVYPGAAMLGEEHFSQLALLMIYGLTLQRRVH